MEGEVVGPQWFDKPSGCAGFNYLDTLDFGVVV